MSGSPRDTRDCGGDPAAYVLGALEPEEVEAFRAHMETCVVCRDEVVAFQRTADALSLAVPRYQAPKALRRRVVRAVRAEARAQPAPPDARSRTRRASLALGWVSARPALGGVALAAAAAAVAIGVTVGSGGGARTLRASVVGLAGSAQVRVTGGRAELIVEHLPPPPTGRIYEVWLKRGSAAPTPTPTLFSVTRTGAADVGVAGNLRGVTDVLVTPEPAGGSLVPTHTPVIVARLD
jgi:anti-sigma-K factor RskA